MRNVWYVDLNCPSGTVGGVEMHLRLYVLPFDVSFYDLPIEEVPCYTGIHTGFYTRPDQESGWYHTSAQGAGNWGRVKLDGYWMTDKVGNHSLPSDWYAGVKVWDVPIGWNSTIASPVVKEINPGGYTQRFEIFTDGSFRIDKFGKWIMRTLDDKIFLNGVRVK